MDLAAIATTIATAFAVMFVAELGDKTQLLALGFGATYPLRVVFAGLLVGFAVAGDLASVAGGLIGAAFPERQVTIAGGILMLVFAAWTLIDRDEDDAPDPDHQHPSATVGPSTDTPPSTRRRAGVLRAGAVTIALSIAVGELGDKTQLATATLAANGHPFAVWIGATAGELSASMLGAFVGNRFADRVDARVLRYASASLFAVFGLLMLLSA